MKRFDYANVKLDLEHEKKGIAPSSPQGVQHPQQSTTEVTPSNQSLQIDATPSQEEVTSSFPTKVDEVPTPREELSVEKYVPESSEEAARIQLQAEKNAQQTEVDGILYHDVSTNRQRTMSVSELHHDEISVTQDDVIHQGEDDSLDDDIDKSCDVEEVSQDGLSSSMDLVSDFKQTMSGTSNSDAIYVDPNNLTSVSHNQSELVVKPQSHIQSAQLPKSSASTNINIVDKNDIPKAYLRNFPKAFVDKVREYFPAATSNDDAVAAYIYIKEGYPADWTITAGIKQAVDSYIGEVDMTARDLHDDFSKEITRLIGNDRIMLSKIQSLEWAIGYLIGLQNEWVNPPAGGEIDKIAFTQPGVKRILNKLEMDSDKQAVSDRERNMRALRGN